MRCRAGVSKVTIYKWWFDKSALAVDAFLADMAAMVQIPDTGSAAEDLRRHVRSAVRFYTGPAGRVFRQPSFCISARTATSRRL
jgi:hypothetical protein